MDDNVDSKEPNLVQEIQGFERYAVGNIHYLNVFFTDANFETIRVQSCTDEITELFCFPPCSDSVSVIPRFHSNLKQNLAFVILECLFSWYGFQPWMADIPGLELTLFSPESESRTQLVESIKKTSTFSALQVNEPTNKRNSMQIKRNISQKSVKSLVSNFKVTTKNVNYRHRSFTLVLDSFELLSQFYDACGILLLPFEWRTIVASLATFLSRNLLTIRAIAEKNIVVHEIFNFNLPRFKLNRSDENRLTLHELREIAQCSEHDEKVMIQEYLLFINENLLKQLSVYSHQDITVRTWSFRNNSVEIKQIHGEQQYVDFLKTIVHSKAQKNHRCNNSHVYRFCESSCEIIRSTLGESNKFDNKNIFRCDPRIVDPLLDLNCLSTDTFYAASFQGKPRYLQADIFRQVKYKIFDWSMQNVRARKTYVPSTDI